MDKIFSDSYIMGTYGRFPVNIVSGKDSTLTDDKGKKYIDFTSGIGVNSLGYANEKWIDAVTEQLKNLQHISNLFFTAPQSVLSEKLAKASGLKKVFFANSGAEANEGAIKLARKYSFDKYGANSNRNMILTLKNSFHGRTVTTLEATGQDKFHNYFFPFTKGFVYAEANNLDDVLSKLSKMNDKICAVMMETIQGEGGVCPLEHDFVKGVADYCNEKDILVIFDEVQTGIGRTGKLFGYEKYGIKPDVITLAKGLGAGLPIGAVICGEKAEKTLGAGDHGSTFGGNPVATSGAIVVLDEVNNEAFLNSVIEKGNYIKEKISAFNSPKVKELRGEGLMLGIVIDSDSLRDYVLKAIENGLLILTAGNDVLRMLPPLTISYDEIDEGLKILEKILVD